MENEGVNESAEYLPSYRTEIVKDRGEGGFVISFPDLPGGITCGETVEAAVENAKDAKRAWLEDAEAGNVQDAGAAFARFRRQHA